MDLLPRIESAMERSVASLTAADCPEGLAGALRQAVIPGGSRLRPQLVIAVAEACDRADEPLVDRAAAAVELLHCASLVQDDLACFDDAQMRRGRPALHCAFGERLAILASDALIVGAFDQLADSVTAADQALQALALTRALARRTGAAGGISAGQAWECEPSIDLAAYHKAKTGALFAAASEAGAIAAGADPAAWASTGELLGCAYQIADDLHDVLSSESDTGKPVHVDALHGRPNAALTHGVDAAGRQLRLALEAVVASVPPCACPDRLIAIIHAQAPPLSADGDCSQCRLRPPTR